MADQQQNGLLDVIGKGHLVRGFRGFNDSAVAMLLHILDRTIEVGTDQGIFLGTVDPQVSFDQVEINHLLYHFFRRLLVFRLGIDLFGEIHADQGFGDGVIHLTFFKLVEVAGVEV
jgi:hypothetical protein